MGEIRSGSLREALARHEYVTRFEIAEPSIEDIFVERVGAPTTDERTLAADPAGLAA